MTPDDLAKEDSLGWDFHRRRALTEKEYLERRLLQGDLPEVAPLVKPQLGPPTPASPAEPGFGEKAGKVAKKAVGASADAFVTGASNFIKGIAGTFTAPAGMPGSAPEQRAKRQAAMDDEAGRSLLGVMQMVGSLFAWGGAGLREALAQYAPGLEGAIAISGTDKAETSPAGYVRSILAAPTLVLDPEFKNADARAKLNVLNAPMTYGELADVIGQMLAGGVASKAVKMGMRGKGPEMEILPPGAPGAPGQRALPPGPDPKALPPRTIVTPPPTGATRNTAYTPDQIALDLRTVLEQTPRPPAEILRERARTDYRTPIDQPTRLVPDPRPPEGLVPEGELFTATERALQMVPEPPPKNPLRTAIENALDRAERVIRNEAGDKMGSMDPALAARMTLGLALGGSQGDTVEEAIAYGFLGMVGSAALRKSLATKLATVYKDSGVLSDIRGSFDFSKFNPRPRVQGSEQPYQPNYSRLNITPDIRALMVNVHRAFKDDILARRGLAKTNLATEQEAIRRIEAGEWNYERALKLGPEEVLGSEDSTALRMLTEQSFQYAKGLQRAWDAGEHVPDGAIHQAMALAGKMAEIALTARMRSGQSTQAWNIPIGGGRQRGYDLLDIQRAADQMLPGWSNAELAAVLRPMTTEHVGKAATFWSVFPEMALDGVYFSYLSGKATLNSFASNVILQPWGLMTRAIAEQMPGLGAAGQKYIPGEARVGMGVWVDGFTDQLRMLRHFRDTAAHAQKLAQAGSLDRQTRLPAIERYGSEVLGWEGTKLGTFADWYATGVDVVGQALRATDSAARVANGRIALKMAAHRQAVVEGKSGTAYEARVNELMNDVSQFNRTQREEVIRYAADLTLTRDFESGFLTAIQMGPKDPWANLVYRGFIMPFFKITARSVEFSSKHTPLLNFIAEAMSAESRRNVYGRKRATAMQDAEARLLAGAGMMVAFGYLESIGWVTGDRPRDPKAAAAWDAAGVKDTSFWFPGLGYRSYKGWTGPMGTLIAQAANLSYMSRHLDEPTFMKLAYAAVLSQMNNIDSRAFTQGISDILNVIYERSNADQIERGMEVVRKRIAGVAVPGIVRELGRPLNPADKRVTRHGGIDNPYTREFYALLHEVAIKTPGFSSLTDANGNYLFPPETDYVTGEDRWGGIIPFNPAPGGKHDWRENDVVFKELRRLEGGGLKWRIPEWIGGADPSAAGLGTALEFDPSHGAMLTPQSRYRYGKIFSQELKTPDGKNFYQALKAMIESPLYQNELGDGYRKVDGGRAAQLQKIDNWFHRATELQLMNEIEPLRAKVLQRKAERQIQKMPLSQQGPMRDNVQRIINNLGNFGIGR